MSFWFEAKRELSVARQRFCRKPATSSKNEALAKVIVAREAATVDILVPWNSQTLFLLSRFDRQPRERPVAAGPLSADENDD